MKELMMEMIEAEPLDVEVQFHCPHCLHPAAAYLKIPTDDVRHVEEVCCLNPEDEHESTVVFTLTEDGLAAKLKDYPHTPVSLTVSDPREEYWDEPEPEPGAYGIFIDAMREWNSHVTRLASSDGSGSLNRMLFGNLYSIAEAYFSDTIIGSALVDVDVQKKLVKLKELGLRDKQLSLDAVLDQPTIVKDMLRATLQGLSFHKLTMVSKISETAFGKPILPQDTADRALVVASVQKRHDCVHRNGRDMTGNLHTDISDDYLKRIASIIERMAESLEEAIRGAQAMRFFEDLDETEAEVK